MTRGSPRLLYLAYSFPPAPVIGSVRAWNSARWLSALGWSVTVVTPMPSVWLRPDEPERVQTQLRETGVKQILTGHRWPMLMPDLVKWIPGDVGWLLGGAVRVIARRLGVEAGAGWAAPAEDACAGLRDGDFDLILATGSGPNVAFRLARRLSRRLRCPFVIDYRDPWTGNPQKGSNRGRAERSEEEELIRDCAMATVVSPSWAELIGGTFGATEKMHVITNGFDPTTFADVRPDLFDHFSVVYAGTLYPPKIVLDPVLRAFRAFAQRAPGTAARFHYYGNFGEPVREAAARLGVSSHVVVHGRVSRRAALQAQKGADLLVVVASVAETASLADRGIVPAKVFDCMALDRPALVVAPRGSDIRAIAETAAGMRCFTGAEIGAMARYIGEVANGHAPPSRDRRAFQWDVIAAKFDKVLRTAIAGGCSGGTLA